VIEWMVAPDSVGQILATEDDPDCLRFIRHRPTEKRSGSYAVTHTVTAPTVLTRGTPLTTDDVPLLRGQSWVSVTSPTEGTTHVTVLAPEAKQWDQRRLTATIYWVDVQWTLPPQAIVQAGQPHTLTTVLRRSSGKPLADWVVRYEVSGGGTAFAPQNQTAIDVTTDIQGAARVNLVPAQKSTTAQIVVKIIRPSKSDDEAPAMVVGQGWTTVTWSAPNPTVTLRGPETAGLGSTITYRVDVSNAGDIAAHRVVASTSIPPNMTFLQSNPPAKVVGNVLTWELNDLAPNTGVPIQILCRPERNGTVRFCVRVESADQLQGKPLSAETCVETRVFSSGLTLKVAGPNTAQVGQRVTYEIEVGNAGADPLTNIIVHDRLPAGLGHATEPGSIIKKELNEPLPAGAARKIAVELIVKQPGRWAHTVDAIADGGHTATATAWLDATAAPTLAPAEAQTALQMVLSGPDRSRVGDLVTYVMQVTNTSQVPLTRVRIVGTYEPSLYPKNATNGFDIAALSRGELLWNVERLPPGERLTREMRFECLQPATASWCRVAIDTAEGARATQQKNTQILPAEKPSRTEIGPAPGTKPAPEIAPERVEGELRVTVADQRDPIAVNDTTTYLIVIENARNVSDKKVHLTIFIPPGMEYVKLTGPVKPRAQSPDGRTIDVTEIAEIRAGETLKSFYLYVKGLRVGKYTLKVKVDSYRSPEAVEATQDTTVNISG
jgi:uncharacterized repeat protein (TIGR01451 family)